MKFLSLLLVAGLSYLAFSWQEVFSGEAYMSENERLNFSRLNNLTDEFIEGSIKNISTETNLLNMYEIVDSIGMAQLSKDSHVKEVAYKGLSEIARMSFLPFELRSSAAIQAMNTKNGSVDTIEMLYYARDNKLIGNDKYYGILATYIEVADEN